MSILLTILLTSLFYISGDSRTCVCAWFSEGTCNSGAECAWRPRYGVGFVKGDTGICRAEHWLDCQHDPDCTHLGNDPEEIEADNISDDQGENEGVISVLNPLNNEDWPYCCNEEDGKPVDCPEERNLPVESEPTTTTTTTTGDEQNANHNFAVRKGNNINTSAKTNNNFLSMSMIGKLIGAIVFFILIGVSICWKFKGSDPKELEILRNDCEHYATF